MTRKGGEEACPSQIYPRRVLSTRFYVRDLSVLIDRGVGGITSIFSHATSKDIPFSNSLIYFFQIQTDKEKLLYELDNLQSQLDKTQLSSTRLQTEKEDFQMDADRQREKCDKLQVSQSPVSPLGKEKT